MQTTQGLLINAIYSSNISQVQKQDIITIVYLKEQANLTRLLNSDTLTFSYPAQNVMAPILKAWYVFYSLFSVYIVVSIVSYFLFLTHLEDIYQVFMCL